MPLPSQLGIPINALLGSGPVEDADLFPGITGILNKYVFGAIIAYGTPAGAFAGTVAGKSDGLAGAIGVPAGALAGVVVGEPGYTTLVSEMWAEMALSLPGESHAEVSEAWVEAAALIPGAAEVTEVWIEYSLHLPPRTGGSLQGEHMERGFKVQGGRLEKRRGTLP